MKVKKGDNVIVITGKDKGKKGKIVKSFPRLNKIIVEGINLSKRHTRSRRQDKKGEIVPKAMPIDASNVRAESVTKSVKKTKK